MKRVNYIITLAACLAALLTSCINEEPYTLETLNLEVNVTRAGAVSEQQGDKISNVMIWAFPMEGTAVKSEAKGWRTYTPTNVTYTSVTVHIPLPMCDGEAKYRLVAIINKGEFGDIVGADGTTPLTLDDRTSYTDLINARFKSNVVDKALTEGKPGEPKEMPVSHWCDVTVTKDNKHILQANEDGTESWLCSSVDMPVYRAVGKTQFFVARNNNFQLNVISVKLINAAAPAEGAALAGVQAGWTTNDKGVDSPSWFIDTDEEPLETEAFGKDLITATRTIEVTDVNFIYSDNKIPAAASGHLVSHYICGKILYETADECTYNDNTYKTQPTGNGYYYEIQYKIADGDTLKRYVPLPPIVRNHDYQVCAMVKEDGGVVVNYTVADWVDVVWDLEFDAAQHTSLMPTPFENSAPTTYPTVRFTGDEEGAAVFFFQMKGPEGITWKPALMNVSAGHYETRVYEVVPTDSESIENMTTYRLGTELITGDIVANEDKMYAIKVVALDAEAHNSRTEPIKLGITHAPQWNEDMDNLLVINPFANNKYYWYAIGADGTATQSVGDQMRVNIYPVKQN